MTWKVVNIGDTGTASKFGADDTDKINKGFSAIDVDDYDINSDWTFRSGKCNFRNPANTFSYNIVAAAIAADRILNLPVLTATDTLVVTGLAQTLSNKTLDSTCVVPSAALASDVVREGIANDFGDFDNSFKDNRIRIWNPADTFRYTITGAAIAADRQLNLPLTTATDTLACLGLAQTFTEQITIKKSVQNLLKLYNDTNTANAEIGLDYNAKNSSSTEINYGAINTEIFTNTAGAEDGRMNFYTMKAGTLTKNVEILGTSGQLRCGGPNRRVIISETNLTGQRLQTFPNNDSVLLGSVVNTGTTLDINTTAAETDMLNFSVGPDRLGANGLVRFTVTGYLLQNQATGTTYTFAVKFGGTTMWADVSPSIAQSATNLPFRITGELSNKNATNAQCLSGQVIVNSTTGATTGIGDISDDVVLVNGNFDSQGADQAKDTTSAQTLQVTVTMSVSNANTKTVVKRRMVELITSA